MSVLDISDVLNLDFGEFVQSHKAEIYQNQNSGPLKLLKRQFLGLKNCRNGFHIKSEWQENFLKFSHCETAADNSITFNLGLYPKAVV